MSYVYQYPKDYMFPRDEGDLPQKSNKYVKSELIHVKDTYIEEEEKECENESSEETSSEEEED